MSLNSSVDGPESGTEFRNARNGDSTTGRMASTADARAAHAPSIRSPAVRSKAYPDGDTGFFTVTRMRIIAIVLADLLSLSISFLTGFALSAGARSPALDQPVSMMPSSSGVSIITVLLPTLVVVIGCSVSWGHYTRRRPFWPEYRGLVRAICYSMAATASCVYLLDVSVSRTWVISSLVLLAIFLPLGRLSVRRSLLHRGIWHRPAIVIGDGSGAFEAARAVETDIDYGVKIIDYIDIGSSSRIDAIIEARADPAMKWTDPAGRRDDQPHLIVSLSDMSRSSAWQSTFDRLMDASPTLTLIPPMGGLPLHGAEMLPIFKQDIVLLRLHNRLKQPVSRKVKRLSDVAIALGTVLVLSPLLLSLIVLVRRDGGPAFYAQERIGEKGRRFRCLKFRSMVVDADAQLATLLKSDPKARRSWNLDHKIKDDPRINRIGRFLRSTSLDELPQLLNVLRGEMSIVGPRPIVQEEIGRYGKDYSYYDNARPGITGLWQISGRNDVSYDQRIGFDVWYARNWSPWLDLTILLRTVPVVLFRTGAY